MKFIAASVIALALVGCGHESRSAALAANCYAASEAVMADRHPVPGEPTIILPRSWFNTVIATQIAIRLNAIEIARINGATIQGADQWTRSLPASLQPTGSVTPPPRSPAP